MESFKALLYRLELCIGSRVGILLVVSPITLRTDFDLY